MTNKSDKFQKDFDQIFLQRASELLDHGRNPDAVQFGQHLQEWIEQSGQPRAELAEQVNISPAELFAIEKGMIAPNDIEVQILQKLAIALDKPLSQIEDLLKRDDLVTVQKQSNDFLSSNTGPAAQTTKLKTDSNLARLCTS